MDVKEFARLDATAMAVLVRSGEVRPDDLANAARAARRLTRATCNPLVEMYEEPTISASANGAPLVGVPMALKDLGATEQGRRSERGSRLFRGTIAARSSAVTVKLQRAGLVNVGRTATSEFAIAATVETLMNGTVSNPWDRTRTTSGSSGGAAAAVALGVVPIAHGTDSGGSLRMPASCCGVVGMKPSRGRVSSAPSPAWSGDLTAEFVVTKSVRDAALLLDVLSGPHPTDSYQVPPPSVPYTEFVRRERRGLRVALVTAHPWGREVDRECLEATQTAAALCEELGHEVVEVEPQLPADDLIEAMTDVWSVAVAAEVGDRESDLRQVEGLSRAWALRGLSLPASCLVRALNTFAVVTQKAQQAFGDADIVLSPTLPTLPPALGIYDPRRDVQADWYFESPIGNLEAFTSLFNVTGQPAMSLPLAESSSGLPIGVQIAANLYREDTLLQLAAQLEEAAPWAARLAPSHASLI